MEFPDSLLYTKEHEWVRVDGDVAVIGITDFAQSELGDIVFVELPEVGKQFGGADVFGVAESVKTVSDLFAPLAGEIIEANQELESAPELVNKSPYDKGWMIKIKMSAPAEAKNLLNAVAYKAMVE